jgi:hypothetical protein
MEDFLKKLAENSSKAAIVALALLLGVCCALYYLDLNSNVEAVEAKGGTDPDEVFAEGDMAVAELMAAKAPIDQSRLVRLQRFNAFDAQQVKRNADYEQDANKRFADAQKHFNSGDLAKAKAVCEEIIDRIYPAHLPAKDLLVKIKEKESEAPAPAVEGGS